MPTPLAFVDLEYTTLVREYAEIWEAACIQATHDGGKLIVEDEFHAFLPVTLDHADEDSLRVGRFDERHPGKGSCPRRWDTIVALSKAVRGRHFVAAVPDGDAELLRRLFDRWGMPDGRDPDGTFRRWHYHLICVENLAAGLIAYPPPWDSDELAARLGVTVDEAERHTALGDARWALRTYAAVYQLAVEARP